MLECLVIANQALTTSELTKAFGFKNRYRAIWGMLNSLAKNGLLEVSKREDGVSMFSATPHSIEVLKTYRTKQESLERVQVFARSQGREG